ncbi:HAD hydrolase-like protein [Pseudomonas sp.]|uniref:HAD hydrolase-like protein n=1 Tax=Pseudomonas sp. TaxID=306 RepID=UPI00289C200E|nr:HAD hydrolase-like protein [Pseudomonas sp.]
MRYQLVIFDFDGTLADSFPFFLESLDTLAQAHRFNRYDPADFDRIRSYDTRQLLRYFDIPLWKIPRVAHHFQHMMAHGGHTVRPFKGVPAMLEALHQAGIQLALVTSNSLENVERILGASARYLDRVECNAPLLGKSSRLKQVVAHCNVSPDATICIGDELRDIQAARKTGIACGAVSWGYASQRHYAEPGPTIFSNASTLSLTLLFLTLQRSLHEALAPLRFRPYLDTGPCPCC